ncbi:MAG: TIGR00282 family metallophosphoesterase [Patescibacteria group bacterium]|nr:YmdB family metallophosphoesterase [Patescibacteria group bacterium]
MKIIFIGDIAGSPGRETVYELLPQVKKEFKPDLIIANGENASRGKGINSSHLDKLHKAGIDFFTSGHHIWQQRDVRPRMDEKDPLLIRPANFPSDNPGKGWRIIETAMMKRLLVINLHGRVFIKDHYDCPFRTADRILEENSHERLDGILVDFHAEATSEKVALGHYLDGRVTAVFGTHTHIPTADLRVLPGGTLYLSDVGMVGLKNGVIGVDKDPILKNFLSQMPVKHTITEEGETVFNAVYFETGKEKEAKQILLDMEL